MDRKLYSFMAISILIFSIMFPIRCIKADDQLTSVVFSQNSLEVKNDYFDDNEFLDESYLLEPDWMVLYLREIEPNHIGSDGDSPPFIMMAGYWDTDISYKYGGTFTMLAYVWDEDDDVANVEIYWEGQPTGAYLMDDGSNGDFSANDGVWGIRFDIPPESVPEGDYLFELRAVDENGNFSDLWPYLTIHP